MRGSSAGITDNWRGTSRYHHLLLTFLDQTVSAVVVTPLTVAYWRGTWCLNDVFLYPGRPVLSASVSLAGGLVAATIFTLFQHSLATFLHPDRHRILYYLLSRLYTTLFSLACVNHWRGTWQLLDNLTGCGSTIVSVITITAGLLLIGTATFRNVSAPPFAIVTDRYNGYFDVPTMFKTNKDSIWIWFVDCIFSVCVIGTLVVFVWRGTWTLLDIYLIPDNHQKSAVYSLVIGYIIVILTFASQPLIKAAVRRTSGLARLGLVDIYLLFSFCGTINVWRGIWNCLNHYFLPDNEVLSYSITHAVCFLLLVLINSSNSIMVRGVYIDAEEEGDQCVDFPCYYLRLFFQEKRKEKLLKKHIEVLKKGVDTDGLVESGKKVQIVKIKTKGDIKSPHEEESLMNANSSKHSEKGNNSTNIV